MANLGEFTGGLALLSWLPCHYRGIPIKLSIDYFKKARGQLFAESTVTPATLSDEMEFMVQTDIKDQQGDIVAVTTAIWRLGVIEAAKE